VATQIIWLRLGQKKAGDNDRAGEVIHLGGRVSNRPLQRTIPPHGNGSNINGPFVPWAHR
jgi:hypothetical protein